MDAKSAASSSEPAAAFGLFESLPSTTSKSSGSFPVSCAANVLASARLSKLALVAITCSLSGVIPSRAVNLLISKAYLGAGGSAVEVRLIDYEEKSRRDCLRATFLCSQRWGAQSAASACTRALSSW